ncbi:formamidopyrimidine-DNA glycosylase [Nitrospira sp.]|nr:formamidopyrimidine-DNA glycosylase [Nitrospira sp.]
MTMPELPDVEVFRKYLRSRALHRCIRTIQVLTPRLVQNVGVKSLQRRLQGRQFVSTQRHGKYLFLRLDRGGWLLLHFGMTGYPVVSKDLVCSSDHAHLRIQFSDGRTFAYFDPRKLGRIGLVNEPSELIRAKNLGPDARTVDRVQFRRQLQQKKAHAKAALMDQQTLAGIGNVYADEILFRAGVSPLARLTDATRATWNVLYRAMQHVWKEAIRKGADPSHLPRTYLLPHRHPGGHCPRCHRPLRTIKVHGRTTYYCPRDQRSVNRKDSRQ